MPQKTELQTVTNFADSLKNLLKSHQQKNIEIFVLSLQGLNKVYFTENFPWDDGID